VAFLQSVANKTGLSSIGNLLNRGANLLSSLGKQNQLQQNNLSTGLVLMVILFSFGLYFNNLSNVGQKNIFPAMEPLPQVVAPRVFHRGEFEATAQTKDILSVLSEQEIPVQRLENAYKRHLARDAVEDLGHEMEITQTPNFHYPNAPTMNQRPSHVVEMQEEQAHDSLTKDTTITTQDTSPNSEVVVSSYPQILNWKANTTYLLCENVKQMLPPHQITQYFEQEECLDPPTISFLIPPDVFGKSTNVSGNNQHVSPCDMDPQQNPATLSYLEVTCRVSDVNYVPMTIQNYATNFNLQSAVPVR